MKSVYTKVHEAIDSMLDGSGFYLVDNPEITNWSNGVEVKMRIKQHRAEIAQEDSDNGISKQDLQPE